MKTYEELTQSVKIPNRYSVKMKDLTELREWILNDGDLGILHALDYAYTLGFSKGMSCERNKLKAKNR